VILKAIKRLTWAGEQTINNTHHEMFQPFNEVLVVGYFEQSYIGVSYAMIPIHSTIHSLI
jgi:hypothetical protein